MSAKNHPEFIQDTSTTTIDLLRHGACERLDTFRGSTDVVLVPEGQAQMEARLKQHQGWDFVITSPLRRCREFAERFCDHNDLELRVDERWRELDFGQWEGQNIEQMFVDFPEEMYRYFFKPGSYTPPGGELLVDARDRVVQAYQELLESDRGQHILVVQHGGTTRLLLTHILDAPLSSSSRFHVPFANLTRICVYHHQDGDFPFIAGNPPGQG